MDIKALAKKVLRYHKEADVTLLEKAYNSSYELLKDRNRASGQPLINHYLDVAYEVADLKLDEKAVAAALLHGLLNKGADQKEIKKSFGEEIFGILNNIEKISVIKKNLSSKTNEFESLRKVLLAASKDIRSVIIKICDKLVNLRDLEYLSENERKRIAKESMEIYAPLAYRLGMGKIKSEIEDLAFEYVDETQYKNLELKVNNIRKDGEKLIFRFKKLIEKELEKEGINATVQARVKHIYSIYRKIVDRSYDINNMADIVGFRIIVNNLDDCYKSLKVVHSNFRPIPSKFKDYIALPKPNGYQSLHTSVVDDEGRIFEIQIRTQEMHDISEEGIASHFLYKKVSHENQFDKKLNWLKQIVENRDESNNFDVDFFGDQIFVFTPKGKVIELPTKSTILDFAYSVHSDIGNHCTGAKVNGNFVALKEELENGDIVEIITSKTQKPSREWLKLARTTKARAKIKQALKEIGKVVTRVYSNAEESKKDLGETLLVFDGDKRTKIKLALCCTPTPGDNIIGIKSSNFRLMVHKKNCKDIAKTKKKNIKVSWRSNFKEPVVIIINAKDRPGLFKEILNSVGRLNITIGKAKGKPVGDGDLECSFSADVGNLDKLNEILNRINKVKNVKKVYISIV